MGPSFRVHAGATLLLGVVLLAASALTLLPGPSVLGDGKAALAALAVPLLPLLAAAVLRGVYAGVGAGYDRRLQWLALRSLPHAVWAFLAVLVAAGAALAFSSTLGGGGLSPREPEGGRYFATDHGDRRKRVEISREEYEALRKYDQRTMFAIPALLCTGATVVVLVAGRLRQPAPPGGDTGGPA
ncbi:hypothetical protein V1L54_09725 [Streptomyces sp. TRM 70361]|uniref:hypothetical protein n=1 Tax=Streptomyces sp. TRM 70361 TaxID=3116553 RepID=UPI002E7C0F84|nr:hypothetical protein [Streptomyces sp. TRM 70361]MEE1939689.1 hypothetical protein [Streptomyces sp. TRM 70361]